MFGRIRLAIAGQVLGKSFDGYAPQTQPSGEIIFGEAQFAAGKTDLTLEIIGSNPHSGGYQVRIGQLKLTPVAGEPLSPS